MQAQRQANTHNLTKTQREAQNCREWISMMNNGLTVTMAVWLPGRLLLAYVTKAHKCSPACGALRWPEGRTDLRVIDVWGARAPDKIQKEASVLSARKTIEKGGKEQKTRKGRRNEKDKDGGQKEREVERPRGKGRGRIQSVNQEYKASTIKREVTLTTDN